MNTINTFLEACRNMVRNIMRHVAKLLDSLSGGRLSPDMVTITGLLAHGPIAWFIAQGKTELAAILLIIFGLFDTLDGALARLQNRESKSGMLLDSVTDRAKEVILYGGVAYWLVAIGRPYAAVWAVLACGASLLVSYINAWGEAVLVAHNIKSRALNKAFRTGLMSFEIRMAALVAGLAFNQLVASTVLVATLSTLTALSRFIRVSHGLAHVQD